MKYLKILLIIVFVFSLFMYWISEPNFKSTKQHITISSELEGSAHEMIKQKADSILQNALHLNDFIGVSTAAYKSDIGTWKATGGYKNKRKAEAPNHRTKFRLASISKPMTAVAIMQLVERGQIDLHAPIQDYLPDFPSFGTKPITTFMLLKHTSGIVHYASDLEVLNFKHYENLEKAMDKFIHQDLDFEPATAYQYSTYGYTVLGAIIENITGVPFREYMKENIWLPAGMMDTDIEHPKEKQDNKASLYIKWKGHYIKSPKTNLSVKYPGGGIQSTAGDLIKFGQALINDSLLDSTSFSMMIQKTDSLKQGVPYGFGWNTMIDHKLGRIIHHGGSQSGVSSFMRIYLDQKIVTATIANNYGSDNEVYFLSHRLAKLMLDPKQPVQFAKLMTADQLNEFVGTYKSDSSTFIIRADESQLFGQLNSFYSLPIYPNSNTEFFYRHFDGELEFQTSTQKKTALIYRNEDEVDSFVKVD